MKIEISALNNQLERLAGKAIQTTTIAGNTIELWVECNPGSENAQNFWIDPPWRIQKDKNIIAASADFPWNKEDGETDADYSARFKYACEKCHCLHSAEIQSITFCAKTADIKINFRNGYELRSFTTWREEESWHYTNMKNKKRYYVSAEKIEITKIA